ncbi:MAG: hypothetical protein A3K65_04520 [Euryarchaeota archaeon RBG_16_68_12]|nr:MAG: hypothetical protein A3K65_04520 [Euryarchaeota archaeon RBG_16_68_12]
MPGSSAGTRTYPSAITLRRVGEYAALVTRPTRTPSRRTGAPRAGTRSPSTRKPTRSRFMWPWYVARAMTSWPS